MRRSAAFSVTELLIAIAIIAALLAILLPVIGRARRAAQAVACAANMSQLGHAMLLYAQQNGGHLPAGFRFTQDPADSRNNVWWTWDDALAPLLGSVSAATHAELPGLYTTNPSPLLQCSSDDRTPDVGRLRSYSMTMAVPSGGGRSTKGMGMDVPNVGYVRLTEARDASGTLLLVENHNEDNLAGGGSCATTPTPIFQRGVPLPTAPSGWDPLPPAHDGTWNYLFCDGHVERLPPEATVPRRPGLTVEERLNHFAGMWTRETDD